MINPVNYSLYFKGRLDARPRYDTYDSFTGLKDKNTLLHDLDQKMYRKEDISIGMLDMDNFKSVNELLGYKVGDEFIKAISNDIATVADKHKIDAYRFGGDEFVVLLFNGSSKEEKMQIVSDIMDSVNKNPIIQGKSEQYLQTATTRLDTYEKSNEKIRNLMSLSTKKETLSDICQNGIIARKDPYVQNKVTEVNENLDGLYNSMVQECSEDGSSSTKQLLRSKHSPQLTEFLIDRFDRNHEAYRLKKWIKDFKQNGFNLTGGVAVFKPSYYIDKQPIDLINEVGEHLKQSKEAKNSYYIEIS